MLYLLNHGKKRVSISCANYILKKNLLAKFSLNGHFIGIKEALY